MSGLGREESSSVSSKQSPRRSESQPQVSRSFSVGGSSQLNPQQQQQQEKEKIQQQDEGEFQEEEEGEFSSVAFGVLRGECKSGDCDCTSYITTKKMGGGSWLEIFLPLFSSLFFSFLFFFSSLFFCSLFLIESKICCQV